MGTGELAIVGWAMVDFRAGAPLEEDGGVGGRPMDGLRGVAMTETASSRGLRNMSYAAIA